MRTTKHLFTTLFLSCLVICLSAPSLWANIPVEPTAPITILTNEEILSEFNPTLCSSLTPWSYGALGPGKTNYIIPTLPVFEIRGIIMKDLVDTSDLPDTTSGFGPGLDIAPVRIEIGELSKYPWMKDTTPPEAETESNFESVIDKLQPFVEGGPVSQTETRAVEKAKEKLYKGAAKIQEKRRKLDKARERVYTAGEELGRAMNDALDAEPGSEEAKKAAKKVEDAAKEAQEAGQEEENALKELKEACEEAEGNYEAYEQAEQKAYEEAEKQNAAAQEAAEKAYEATGHGNKK